MTRTSLLSALCCAATLAVISAGCGSSSPAGTGKAGTGGHAGTQGSAGTTGNAGTGGGAGTTGNAGTSGGSGTTGTAGTGGGAGTTGNAGTGGGAGTTGNAGTGGATDGGNTDVKTDTMMSEAGGDVAAAPVCGDGNRCNDNGSMCETACVRNRQSVCLCYDPAGGPTRLEYSCFTDVVCTSPDAGADAGGGGTDAGGDAGGTTDAGGTDAGAIMSCPAGIMSGDACNADGGAFTLCATTCTNNMQRTCNCGRTGWRCSNLHRCL